MILVIVGSCPIVGAQAVSANLRVRKLGITIKVHYHLKVLVIGTDTMMVTPDLKSTPSIDGKRKNSENLIFSTPGTTLTSFAMHSILSRAQQVDSRQLVVPPRPFGPGRPGGYTDIYKYMGGYTKLSLSQLLKMSWDHIVGCDSDITKIVLICA